MDSQGNMQTESGKLEQIISHFYSKSLHIILGSRVPSLHNGGLSTSSRAKKSDKWFNLLLGDRPAALDYLNYWRINLMDPMIIDIVLVQEGTSSSSETILERWVVQYECPPRVLAPQTRDYTPEYKKAYQKSIVLFRSLYSQMRLLPVHRICKRLSTSSHTCNFDITYEVSSFSNPFSRPEEKMMEEYSFTAVEAFPGRLCISVTYRTTLSNLNLEFSTLLPQKVIKDYVGSPNTSPLMSFPSREKGVCTTSFPLRGLRPMPSVADEHHHSWTTGFHEAAPLVQNKTIVGSPPICRPCHRTSDFPTDGLGNRIPSYPNLTRQRPASYNEYRPSTFSPSPSPSHSLSPRSFLNGSPMQTQSPSAATTSLSGMGKGPRNFSPNFSDSSGNSLPLLSPRSTKDDKSLQKSSSVIRSSKKIDAHRAGGVHSRAVNYGVQKIVRDNKDDSGRLSGLLSSSSSPRIGFSRSSSKSSFQDDFDDWDFSCSFDVDGVDMLGVQPSNQNVDDKNASEITSKAPPLVRKSQYAAIGVLVHMLRAAPPLHQDPACVPSQSLKTETEEGVTAASGASVLRKTDDALEELRSYRKMRDLLLSKSEIGVMNKYEG